MNKELPPNRQERSLLVKYTLTGSLVGLILNDLRHINTEVAYNLLSICVRSSRHRTTKSRGSLSGREKAL